MRSGTASTAIPGSTIPKAICQLVEIASAGGGRGIALKDQKDGEVNKSASQFETFARNMFAECMGALPRVVDARWESTFSYTGTRNNPPDFMIRNGDAVEVKKLNRNDGKQKGGATIELNSSPPKRSLKSDDPLINRKCREAEDWTEKDMLYFVGQVTDEYVEAVWLIDGRCMVASEEKYRTLSSKLSDALKELGGEPTGELGRFNTVDPLGVSSLRVRPMWIIKHPSVVFQDEFVSPKPGWFVFNALVSELKWDNYSSLERVAVDALVPHGVVVRRVSTPDPDDENRYQACVHISWHIEIK
jgi:hypothetical protein